MKIYTGLFLSLFLTTLAMPSLANQTKGITAQKIQTTSQRSTAIEGLWLFNFVDSYADDSKGSYYVEYEATASEDGIVTFADLSSYEKGLIARFDESTGKLTFEDQRVTSTSYFFYEVSVFQEPFTYNWIDDKVEYGPISAQLSSTDNGATILFDASCGIEWTAYDNLEEQKEEDFIATLDIVDILGAASSDYVNNEDDDKWENIGEALLQDGWLLPKLGFDQSLAENQYKVPMQRSKVKTSVYRLVNPYKYGPAAEYNECRRDGYIIIDMTDPNLIIINPDAVDAGFTNASLGISRFICYNRLAFYQFRYNLDPSYVPLIFPKVPLTTYTGGVLTMTGGYDASDQLIFDANFGTQDFWFGGGEWRNDDDKRLSMLTKIWFPGTFDAVDSISAEDEDATVKYYNLQGQEIKTPASGETVIKISGNKSSKIFVK